MEGERGPGEYAWSCQGRLIWTIDQNVVTWPHLNARVAETNGTYSA